MIPNSAWLSLGGSVFVSAALAALLIWGLRLRDPVRTDDPQHVHAEPVPRTGGIAIFFGCLLGVWFTRGLPVDNLVLVTAMLAGSVPIFAAGISEDLSGRVPPRWRYYASLLAALIVILVADTRLERFDLPYLDDWLQWGPASVVVTLFCVAGVTQAYNIIDGKNGLAAGSAIIALLAIAFVAHGLDDSVLRSIALASAGSLIGFMLFNFPRGLIFLGDGGAYLVGFYTAVLSVMLVSGHPEISAWFPCLLSAYAIIETLTSVLRRLLIDRNRFDEPDNLHMHSLIYRLLSVHPLLRARLPWVANALTAVPFLLMAVLIALGASQDPGDTQTLRGLGFALVFAYFLVYILLRLRLRATAH